MIDASREANSQLIYREYGKSYRERGLNRKREHIGDIGTQIEKLYRCVG